MDSYDKLNQATSKYIVPVLFAATGIVLLITGLSKNVETNVVQSSWFKYAGLVLTIMGILGITHFRRF